MADPLSITASIIAILQAASVTVACLNGMRQSAKDTKDLINEFGSLQGILTSLHHYASANPDSTTLQTLGTPLRECLNDIKKLQAKLEPKSSIRRGMLRLGWVLKEKECSQYLGKVERLKSSISLAIDLDRESQSKAMAIWAKKGAEGEKRKKIIKWLNPTTCDERHLEISGRRQRGTGEWLLKEKIVVDWVRGDSAARLLLGYGIPGAGKTFLASLMIDDLRSRAIARNWGVAFIYFNHSEQNQQTPIFFLSSIVKQFACQVVNLPEQLIKLYDHIEQNEKRPTFEQLYSLLIAVTRPFTQAFIICDALDECDQYAQRKELLPLFNQMGEDGMRLFLTSRPYPEDIQDALQSAARIELSAKSEDIAVYIERKIAENRRAESLVKQAKCKERIISMLQTSAGGMFLLVHFHIRYLCQQTTPRQLLEALEMLEGSSGEGFESPLYPTYDRAMEIIQSQHKNCVKLAVNILTWLVKSQRVLTVRELQQAVSVEQHQTMFDELALPSEKTMIDVCSSLVSIDQDSNTVRLAHYTVKEYLVSNPIINKGGGFRIIMACTAFLSYRDFSDGSHITAMLSYTPPKMYPFLGYACTHLRYHLQQCDEALSLDLVLRFLSTTLNLSAYMQATAVRRFSNSSVGFGQDIKLALIMAAYLGHTSAMRVLLKEGNNNSSCLMVGWVQQAFEIAVESGNNSIVGVLLENGADVSATDNKGRTPLHLAVSKGYNMVVSVLVEHGADVSVTDKEGRTPLHLAVSKGNKEVVSVLVEHGADISVADRKGQTPLHLASHGDWWRLFRGSSRQRGRTGEISKILVEKGADTSAMDKEGRTPLHLAVSEGNKEVVSVLVEHGADVSVTDKEGRTLLHLAVSEGNKEVASVLVEHGADTSAMDKEGLTPLHLAVSEGNKEVVSVLVEHGADTSAMDKKGLTPLHLAVSEGNKEVISVLVEHGANFSVTDKEGRTPLHLAASKGNDMVVSVLVEHGADVSVTDKDGRTPLHLVGSHEDWGGLSSLIFGQPREIVQILVEKGADISATGKEGRTPLHLAASKGDKEVVSVLVEYGADVSVTGKGGRTPLHTATPQDDRLATTILAGNNAGVPAVDSEGRLQSPTLSSLIPPEYRLEYQGGA